MSDGDPGAPRQRGTVTTPAPARHGAMQNPIHFLRGFAFGLHYPALVFAVTWELADARWLNALQQHLAGIPGMGSAWSDADRERLGGSPHHGAQALPRVLHLLQRSADLPLFEEGRVIAVQGRTLRYAVPIFPRSVQPMLATVRALLQVVEQLAAGVTEVPLTALSAALKALAASYTCGSNVPPFLQAALARHLPFTEVAGEVIQFGQGRRGRWLQSSFTDATPQIAATLSRDKKLCAQVLRRAGIPVPAHETVRSDKDLSAAAQRLGYPVVIKPADLDGGVGVAAGLDSLQEVEQAYVQALRHSRNILIEKHIAGRDYRLTVFQNEVVWVIERQPAGVQGDGVSSVVELIATANQDARRGDGVHSPLKSLVLDDEAQSLLRRDGLEGQSIPPKGRFLRFRRSANIASGGLPMAVPLAAIHPDNLALAVRAAHALKLDLAGVDLLIPDITVSWLAGGAAVCEVNAQPQLGRTTSLHLYPLVLGKLVPGNGRIPIMLIFGGAQADALVESLEAQWSALGRGLGVADAAGVRLGAVQLGQAGTPAYHAGALLLAHTGVDAIAVVVKDKSLLENGLPFVAFDMLVVTGDHAWDADTPGSATPDFMVHQHACDGNFIALGFADEKKRMLETLSPGRFEILEMDGASVAVMARLDRIDQRHGKG